MKFWHGIIIGAGGLWAYNRFVKNVPGKTA
jgi:hypothetical protein